MYITKFQGICYYLNNLCQVSDEDANDDTKIKNKVIKIIKADLKEFTNNRFFGSKLSCFNSLIQNGFNTRTLPQLYSPKEKV